MPRVKRGTVRRAKRKKLLSLAKGYYANKSKLYRAAKESVDTALKYARTRVTVGVASANGTLELRVDDDGPGIDPNDLPHVFDRLYTSRPAPGRKVGTGLGLAIVRDVAEIYGGGIRLEFMEQLEPPPETSP